MILSGFSNTKEERYFKVYKQDFFTQKIRVFTQKIRVFTQKIRVFSQKIRVFTQKIRVFSQRQEPEYLKTKRKCRRF